MGLRGLTSVLTGMQIEGIRDVFDMFAVGAALSLGILFGNVVAAMARNPFSLRRS